MTPCPLLTCIALLDEFPWNHHIPWKESLNSALAMCGEVVVVLGERRHSGQDIPVRQYLDSLRHNSNLRVLNLPWPKDWSWMFIAQALNMGMLHAKGKWVCRLLMDELFALEQKMLVADTLQTTQADIVSVSRNYVLGSDRMFPAVTKPFFFRRNSGYVYGRVSPHCPDALMFDNPVRLGFWGRLAFRKADAANYLNLYPLPPAGERASLSGRSQECGAFILNTDVTFFTAEEIFRQKYESKKGYERLPEQYKTPLTASAEEVVAEHLAKVKRFAESDKVRHYAGMPEGILRFFQETDITQAPILNLLTSTR